MRYERDGFSVESAIAKNRPLPAWYEDEPELESSDVFYLKGFHDLSTCRSIGMGMGPIPWRDIIEYAGFYRLDEDITEAFVDIIREMDTAYLGWHSEERERKRKLDERTAKKPGRKVKNG